MIEGAVKVVPEVVETVPKIAEAVPRAILNPREALLGLGRTESVAAEGAGLKPRVPPEGSPRLPGGQEGDRPSERVPDLVEHYHFEVNGPPPVDDRSFADRRLQVYKTDLEGRPRVAEGWIAKGERHERDPGVQKKTSSPYNVLGDWEPTPRDRDLTFHGSHLIAHGHKGADESYNLIALPSESNLSDMKKVENEMERRLKDGKAVYQQTYIDGYIGDTHIPTQVTTRLYERGPQGPVLAGEWTFFTPRVH